MAAYRDRVYGARGIVTSLYGSLQGQGLWCKGKCSEFVWQLTWTETIFDGYRELAGWLFDSVTIDVYGEFSGSIDVGRDKFGHLKSCYKRFHFSHACTSRQSV